MGLREVLQQGLDAQKLTSEDLRRPALRQAIVQAAPATVAELLPPPLTVRSSIGAGRLADVPWIGIFRPKGDPKTGVYLVYLFSAKGESVFLSLNQGVSAVEGGRRELARRAQAIRNVIGEKNGLDNSIELQSDLGLPRKYEAANIYARRYDNGAVPENYVLRADLHRLIDIWNEAQAAARAATSTRRNYKASDRYKRKPALAGARERIERSRKRSPDRRSMLLEVSERRNEVERHLRTFLKIGLRFRSGRRAASEALSALPSERRAVLAHYGYETMWSHMYFNELKIIVEKHWEAFQAWIGEDRDEVIRWLTHINKSRVDAHARELDDEEFAYLRICFKKLDEAIRLG